MDRASLAAGANRLVQPISTHKARRSPVPSKGMAGSTTNNSAASDRVDEQDGDRCLREALAEAGQLSRTRFNKPAMQIPYELPIERVAQAIRQSGGMGVGDHRALAVARGQGALPDDAGRTNTRGCERLHATRQHRLANASVCRAGLQSQ